MEFRKLRADEIEVRVQSVKENGCVLLLYKDARCDMNILDETVGAENWTRSHELINGNLFCNVGIKVQKGVYGRDFDEWVFKQDVGTESNTEKEKGQASDSFKRACFNWGIGRELYTAPFIWVSNQDCNIINKKTYDKFKVTKIRYENNKISELDIKNEKTNKIVFRFNLNGNISFATKEQQQIVLKAVEEGVIKKEMIQQAVKEFGKDKFKDLTYEQAESICKVAKKRLNN